MLCSNIKEGRLTTIANIKTCFLLACEHYQALITELTIHVSIFSSSRWLQYKYPVSLLIQLGRRLKESSDISKLAYKGTLIFSLEQWFCREDWIEAPKSSAKCFKSFIYDSSNSLFHVWFYFEGPPLE